MTYLERTIEDIKRAYPACPITQDAQDWLRHHGDIYAYSLSCRILEHPELCRLLNRE